ncbi:MAG: trehalose-6-phosphate synthase [bacterium]
MAELHDLVIVANRLPVRRVHRGGRPEWVLSPGGLVSALGPVLEGSRGIWVGWAGSAAEGASPTRHGTLPLRAVPVSKSELDDYYYGFCNRSLWPLYHDCVRAPEYRRSWWEPYRTVNRRYAEIASSVAAPGATVWVHDYHLQLVPGVLRKLRPDLRVGFFLHVPFPPRELFAQLPWRREILEGLLAADVVGFQTRAVARNFASLARRYTDAKVRHRTLYHHGRRVRVGDFPVSIDVDRFESLARSPQVRERAAKLRRALGPSRKVILGVDRLDYTKGIDRRLEAFRDVLARGHATPEDCVLVQVAVPSRERVGTYAGLREEVERLVGQINGEFADVGRVAVHYLHRNLPPEELAALYIAADVMLVTPFRDGMNLVAKEYVASRLDDTGVLVLSEFTGAAQEMRQALLVNPHDVDGVANTVVQALRMRPSDAAKRMRRLRAGVKAHDVHAWGREFLGAVRDAGPAPEGVGSGSSEETPEETRVSAS